MNNSAKLDQAQSFNKSQQKFVEYDKDIHYVPKLTNVKDLE